MKYFLSVLCFLLLSSFLHSCLPDHCIDNVCNNGGICVDGNCSCLNGYEGAHCEEVWNDRFLGNWSCEEKYPGSDSVTQRYSAVLAGTGDPAQFVVMNLGNSIDSIVCRRKSYYEFVFSENQQIDSGTVLQSGSGLLDSSSKKVTASYIIKYKDTSIAYSLLLAQ